MNKKINYKIISKKHFNYCKDPTQYLVEYPVKLSNIEYKYYQALNV